jgi:hypothetical protein
MKQKRNPAVHCTRLLAARVTKAERAVATAARKLSRLKDPMKKCKLMWQLSWLELRDLEDFRPAGGFAANSISSP